MEVAAGNLWARRDLLKTVAACGAGGFMTTGITPAQPPSELTRLPLVEAMAMLRRKAVSPVELAQAFIARIERLNPVLNAFITVTAEQALQQAREAEAQIHSEGIGAVPDPARPVCSMNGPLGSAQIGIEPCHSSLPPDARNSSRTDAPNAPPSTARTNASTSNPS